MGSGAGYCAVRDRVQYAAQYNHVPSRLCHGYTLFKSCHVIISHIEGRKCELEPAKEIEEEKNNASDSSRKINCSSENIDNVYETAKPKRFKIA